MLHVYISRYSSITVWLRLLVSPKAVATAAGVTQGCGYSCWCHPRLWLQLLVSPKAVATAVGVTQGCGYSCWCHPRLWLQLLVSPRAVGSEQIMHNLSLTPKRNVCAFSSSYSFSSSTFTPSSPSAHPSLALQLF